MTANELYQRAELADSESSVLVDGKEIDEIHLVCRDYKVVMEIFTKKEK